jgi:hypothetical protein
MKLLTAEVRAQLPPLYSQEKNEDLTVHVLCSGDSYVVLIGSTQGNTGQYGLNQCGRSSSWPGEQNINDGPLSAGQHQHLRRLLGRPIGGLQLQVPNSHT